MSARGDALREPPPSMRHGHSEGADGPPARSTVPARLRAAVPAALLPVAAAARRRGATAVWRLGLRRRLRPVRWGNLRRVRPISGRYGFDRGTPVDRVLLDRFFADHGADIRGRVLEVRDAGFTEQFGTEVTAVDIVDVDPTNDHATIIVDLADPDCLPSGRFDCAIVAQTLQYVADLRQACANLWASLAPGGCLLVTVPTVAKLDHHLRDVDRWRITPAGLATVLEASCPGGEVRVSGRGNVLVAAAFLMGISAEELDRAELDTDDPEFPILAVAVARRPL